MSIETSSSQSSFVKKYQFWLLLIAALVCRNTPILSIPFNWLESYFHEISHGLAAIATGGSIVSIQLFADGAGLCTSQGGIRFVTSFMGYAGAALWGALIYCLASAHLNIAKGVSLLIIALLVLTAVLWTRDILTLFILGILILLFSLKLKLADNQYVQLFLQLFGLIVLLNALMSPLYLLDGRALGDGATLASITLIPEIIWVAVWVLIAGALLYFLSKQNNKTRN